MDMNSYLREDNSLASGPSSSDDLNKRLGTGLDQNELWSGGKPGGGGRAIRSRQ